MTSDDTSGPATPASEPTPGPRPGPPKPGPKPGPRPGPGPKPAAQTPTPVPAVAVGKHESFDPRKFGRIDEQGVVWLITADGEREIGSWQAGTIDEGLAHFARRYSDLETEVEILEERLAARTGDPRKSQAAAKHLLDTLSEASVIGDVSAIEQRLTVIVGSADDVADSLKACLLYTSPSPRDKRQSRMPSSA